MIEKDLSEEIAYIEKSIRTKFTVQEVGYLDGEYQEDAAILSHPQIAGDVWIRLFNGNVSVGHVGDVATKKDNDLLKKLLKYLDY